MPSRPPTHSDIFDLLHQIRHELEKLSERVGEESDDGLGVSGLTGRIIRTEAKVLAYDKLKERVIGGFIAATASLAAIWWLTKDKIAQFFNVATG